jgi:hypothetical protein
MRGDIHPGATFPDYALTDHTGTRRQVVRTAGEGSDDPDPLSRSLLPQGPPAARNYADFYPELKVGYTRIVTISTDNLVETNELP